MRAVDLIRKKRDAGEHSREEIEFLISAYTHGDIPDYQMSAWLMAAWLCGLNRSELAALTEAMLCSGELAGAGSGTLAAAAAGCNNNWSMYYVGSRLQWDVTKSFYLAVDVLYQRLNSASLPGNALTATTALTNSGATTVSDQSNWLVGLRMHKDFLP